MYAGVPTEEALADLIHRLAHHHDGVRYRPTDPALTVAVAGAAGAPMDPSLLSGDRTHHGGAGGEMRYQKPGRTVRIVAERPRVDRNSFYGIRRELYSVYAVLEA